MLVINTKIRLIFKQKENIIFIARFYNKKSSNYFLCSILFYEEMYIFTRAILLSINVGFLRH